MSTSNDGVPEDETPRCGAATRSGKPCRNRVAHEGERCRVHQGQPAASEPASPEADEAASVQADTGEARTGDTRGGRRGPSRTARRPGGSAPRRPATTPRRNTGPRKVSPPADVPPQEAPPRETPEPPKAARDPRLDRAAARCAPAVANGAMAAVDALAVPYLGESGWKQLRDAWRTENCALVATVARQALESPARLHDAAGKLAAQVWIWLGRPWVEQMMVREVVKRLPILGESQVRPVARAVQLAGIRLCHAHDEDLTHCPCFADLVEREGERRPRQLLDAAAKGWEGLGRLR